jgi:hypothetical protein
MDLTLRRGYWIKLCMKLIAVKSHDNYYNFIALLASRYSNRLLPLIRQFFLTPKRMNDFMDLRRQCFNSGLKIVVSEFLTTTWRFILFNFTAAISISKGLGLGTTYYLPIQGSIALVDLGSFFSFVINTESVRLLGWGISPSQGPYIRTEHHRHRINVYRHPCLEWNSNPQSQYSSGRRRLIL